MWKKDFFLYFNQTLFLKKEFWKFLQIYLENTYFNPIFFHNFYSNFFLPILKENPNNFIKKREFWSLQIYSKKGSLQNYFKKRKFLLFFFKKKDF